MKYLFILFLVGCGVTAQTSEEIKKEAEFNNLITKANETNVKSAKVQALASKREAALVTKAVSTIITMKAEISELKTEISETKSKVDTITIYIHDTILIKEKKNFWGKTKTDTTN